jgi:adenine-specific DNA-methyltransferase
LIVLDPKDAVDAIREGEKFVLFNGDCAELLAAIPADFVDLTVTSPPYFMGKSYDRSYRLDDFLSDHEKLGPEISRITKSGGNICWQVGYHVKHKRYFP